MKIGTTARSITEPTPGFVFRREGYSIYASYIIEDSITTVFVPDAGEKIGNEIPGHTEYEYIEYSLYKNIASYEELISKLILLKYTLEDEMSLINKMIANENVDEYAEYREYVNLCKTAVKNSYISLGLNKIGK